MSNKSTGPAKPPVTDAQADKNKTSETTPTETASSAGKKPADVNKPAKTGTATNRAGVPTSDAAKSAGAEAPDAKPSDTKTSDAAGVSASREPGSAPKASEADAKASSVADRPLDTGSGGGSDGVFAATLIGVIGGGVLGLAAAYAIAWAGMWPVPADNSTDPLEQQLTTLSDSQQEIQQSLSALETRIEEAPDVEQRLSDVEQVVAALPEPTNGSADVSGLSASLEEVQQRLEELEAGAGGAASGDTAALSEAQGAIDQLSSQLAELEQTLGAQQTEIGELSAAADDAGPDTLVSAIRLPLVLSSLETAFNSGRAFTEELDALGTTLPELAIPDALSDAADTGLARPDQVASAFRSAMPDMLARQPVDENADWTARTGAWLQSVLAIRPSGEVAGETPQAVLSQVEAALARQDFIEARDLLATLPEPMLAAAGDVTDMVARQAAADEILIAARRSALDVAEEVGS
ncbi:hypothetical protein GCM10007989_18830 [Devosia pacifica]|uniref:Mitochondrial inner membrane protein n=1 Tax=Devosia pacifica TaxID=1335967 RepID=A0A918S4G2_9HYPH|nr:hypothetical protein [Devosia pacifica]GHA23581.1 hypothetical protein GCM10007989_18830 [Devosia pacifica]